MLLLPQTNGESPFAAFCGLSLYDAAGEVRLEHRTEGALALVALSLLKTALVVDYQDRYAFGPEGLDTLLEEPYYVPGSFRVTLEGRSQRIHHHKPYTVFFTRLQGRRESFSCRMTKGAHVEQILRRCIESLTTTQLVNTP